MGRQRAIAIIIAPSLLYAAMVRAEPAHADGGSAATPFELDARELDPIRFTRLEEDAEPASTLPARGTEFSLSLRPGRADFSRAGVYGLGALFDGSELSVQSEPTGIFGQEALTGLNEGLSYSAGVRIEHEDADIDGTAYVSSSLLGLSYGRLGRLWYGGIDVNLERFADERHGSEQPDVLSLDLTTGRRLGITGLGTDAPLWLLSVHGDFDLLDAETDDAAAEAEQAWYLNPSLFWQHPGFTFSAGMELPVDTTLSDDDETVPDYRLRAVFEKRFK